MNEPKLLSARKRTRHSRVWLVVDCGEIIHRAERRSNAEAFLEGYETCGLSGARILSVIDAKGCAR